MVKSTFEKLYSDEREILIKFLNQDGISERPGFIMDQLPEFLENCGRNTVLGNAETRFLK